MDASRILVVEHEQASREAIVGCLRYIGFDAQPAANAAAARKWLALNDAALIVISLNLPDGTMEDVVGIHHPSASALALVGGAARSKPVRTSSSAIHAVFKRPVPVQQIVDRVEYLLGRVDAGSPVPLQWATLTLDPATGLVHVGTKKAALAPTEVRLLTFFILHAERAFSRLELLRRLWPGSVRVGERTVDVHVGRLRRALAQLGCAHYIQTVHRTGYRLSAIVNNER